MSTWSPGPPQHVRSALADRERQGRRVKAQMGGALERDELGRGFDRVGLHGFGGDRAVDAMSERGVALGGATKRAEQARTRQQPTHSPRSALARSPDLKLS